MSKPDKEIINLPVVAPAREVKKLKQQCYTFARDFRRKAATIGYQSTDPLFMSWRNTWKTEMVQSTIKRTSNALLR